MNEIIKRGHIESVGDYSRCMRAIAEKEFLAPSEDAQYLQRVKDIIQLVQEYDRQPLSEATQVITHVDHMILREWRWWAHTGGGNVLAFKQPT
jgi:hypothetical protein